MMQQKMEKKDLRHAFDQIEAMPILKCEPLKAPIFQCFNWNELFEKQGFEEDVRFYVVTFRCSITKPVAAKLEAADKAICDEGKKAGGLLCYYSTDNVNLRGSRFSMHIWEAQEGPQKASKLQSHVEAKKLWSHLCDNYIIERFWVSATADSLPAFELIDSVHSSKSP